MCPGTSRLSRNVRKSIMKETPHPAILDRETSVVHIKEHFAHTVELVREVVNYGSNLIPRCFVSSDRKILDIVILGALLKQAVTMLDAIEILVSQGAVLAAYLQARSLFEARLYLAWILEKDTERRAKQYFVWQKREEALWAKRSIPGTAEHKRFRTACDRLLSPGKPTVSEDEAKAQLENIKRLLDSSEFSEINSEFDKLKKHGKDFDVSWYCPRGPSTLADMARRMNLSGEYMLFYNTFSKATHCQEFRRHVSIERNVVKLQPIRHLEGIKTLLNVSISYALTIYEMILKRYRPGELSNFGRKYKNEWRERFMNIPTVKYKVTGEGEPI